jgi:serine O-acetyltransferase
MALDHLSFFKALTHRISSYFPEELLNIQNDTLHIIHMKAIASLAYSLSYTINRREFYKPICPNPLDTGHYCLYLYFLSRSARLMGHLDLADLLFGLNKMLHSIDLYHAVRIGPVIHLEHPLATVLGRAIYGNYTYIGQCVTVGRTMNPSNSDYPIFGDNIIFSSDVTVIGTCSVGTNVIFSTGAYVKNQDVPSNSIVFGRSPNLIIKSISPTRARSYFDQMFHLPAS